MISLRTLLENHFLVTKEFAGLRADQYLKRKIGRLSRSKAQKIICNNDFLIDCEKVKPSRRVKTGERITLKRFSPDISDDISSFKVEIVYEDDDILLLNKPSGLTLHPTAFHFYKTLTYWLKKNFPKVAIHPCHRIDKDTSGLVLCAKNKQTEIELKKAFMHKHVQKTYLAVVFGVVKNSMDIKIPLALQRGSGLVKIRMMKDEKHGKEAFTRVRPVKLLDNRTKTLLMCRPYTGRQHQIRAHLSLIGHPIINDLLYGHDDEIFDAHYRALKADQNLKAPPHKLHAYSLRFALKGKKFFFKCKPPENFLASD